MKKNLLLLILLLATIACSNTAPKNEEPIQKEEVVVEQTVINESLYRKWELLKLGTETVELPNQPFLNFVKEGNRVNGHTGGNLLSGGFTGTGIKLKFNQLITTRRYDRVAAPTESKFLEVLNKTESYKIDGSVLNLYDEKNNELATLMIESDFK